MNVIQYVFNMFSLKSCVIKPNIGPTNFHIIAIFYTNLILQEHQLYSIGKLYKIIRGILHTYIIQDWLHHLHLLVTCKITEPHLYFLNYYSQRHVYELLT